MTPGQLELRQLLQQQQVAALGTLRKGDPFVSMVPYALLPGGLGLVIHVSRLATHTADMQAHAGVSLLVMAQRSADVPPQALARATLQGQARKCAADAADYAQAKQAYLARFPDSEHLFGFADFSLWVIVPRAVRFIGGFAQAWSVNGEAFVQIMAARE